MATKEQQPKQGRPRPEPRPSACIILVSPTNQVLLLHRVHTSSAFPSAHVFPGGNLSAFHDIDGDFPLPGDVARHEDSLTYRLTAIRETFEESGILLARDTRRGEEGALLHLPTVERDKARKAIYENKVPFVEWVKDAGGAVDIENLLPFTRWITPEMMPKRFSTQMYIYMLPLSSPSQSPGTSSEGEEDPTISEAARSEAMIPTPDGGVEHTAARFDEAATWLEKHRRDEIVLFPPQYFLLHLISQFLTGPPPPAPNSPSEAAATERHYYRKQREQLVGFLETVPTTSDPKAARHPTAQIPWSRKVISPTTLGVRQSDRRSILGLDKPGYELRGTDRGGDMERVVLVKFEKGGLVRNVKVRGRAEVLAEEREVGREATKAGNAVRDAKGAEEGKGGDGSKL
ncbi:putative nudix family protein [Eutypa lata UCREL1]|uniref:Putative nudix family protein n=1 Tax=Eutypa lata (strain UCR-EL1) TaxID=1287681 RepID=M7SGC7_EUTLA|nr:putative nudix family protein [Eutypa lata UCREL1]